MKSLAPVILFVFRRPEHTRKTLEALANNTLAKESTLYIYADAAKEGASMEVLGSVQETRKILKEKQWCKEVHIVEREKNKGLADSIIAGVTDMVNQYGKVIVLEDDIVTSSYFLQYMNDALDIYENEEKVMHISGYLPLTTGNKKLPELFFMRHMSCWGWATWKRAWDKFNPDTNKLYDELQKREDIIEFDLNNTHSAMLQLNKNIDGSLKTWAVKWYTTIFLNNGLCLVPRISFVDNIGIEDGTGENSHSHDKRWRIEKLSGAIDVKRTIPIINNMQAYDYLARCYKYGNHSSAIDRFFSRLKRMRYLNLSEIYNITLQKIFKHNK